MKSIGGIVLVAALLQGQDAGAQAATPHAELARARPRIGLVLGGGGAKGAAHVGVLRVLEEMRIPIDCIVGTSMGALVGGIYAANVDASELEKSVLKIHWNETIAFSGRRERLPIRRKLSGVTYSNNLEFGVRDGSLIAPSGFINTQHIQQTIQYLTRRGLGINNFDELPIPFRAIATDMQSGEMAVLSQGDLAIALRASMSVPGLFSPVTIDGRILGDGGLVRNVPIDVARKLCAEVVIAVAVPNPMPTVADLSSPLTLASRTLDVMIGANEREQLRSLGPDDVSIVIDMGEIGSASFDRIPDAIPIGRAAAEAQRATLARYSIPEGEYFAWRGATRAETPQQVKLAGVEIHGNQRVNADFIASRIGLQAGDVVDAQKIGTKVDRLFAIDDFYSVQYRLRGEAEEPTLDIVVTEKPWGPHFVTLDYGLFLDTNANNAFTLGAHYLKTWINPLGGELRGAVRVGRTSGLNASLYQPLEQRRVWFVEPGVYLQRSAEDVYDDGDAVARYELAEAMVALEAGRVFGDKSELRVGLQAGGQSAERDISPREFPELNWAGHGGWTARYNYDSRDREILGTHGVLARLDYFRAEDSLGATDDYDRLEGVLSRVISIDRNVLHLRAAGGTSFDSELPIYDAFTLGGPISFPGLALGELRGNDYWTLNATYLHKVVDLVSLFGQALYAGFGITAGDMHDRIDLVREDPLYSGSVIFGGRTPIGPIALTLAVTSNSSWQLVFVLGRPVEERAITDPVW